MTSIYKGPSIPQAPPQREPNLEYAVKLLLAQKEEDAKLRLECPDPIYEPAADAVLLLHARI